MRRSLQLNSPLRSKGRTMAALLHCFRSLAYAFRCLRRRRHAAARPVPTRSMEAGSGTGAVIPVSTNVRNAESFQYGNGPPSPIVNARLALEC